MKFRLLAAGALLAASLANALAQPAPKAYATPQAVFAAAHKAAQKDDWKTIYACITPESREAITGQLVSAGVLFKTFAASDKSGKFAELSKPFEAAFKKYGLTKDALDKLKPEKLGPDATPREQALAARKYATAVEANDRPAFVADMMKGMAKFDKKHKKVGDATLKDVKITGNTATATSVEKKDDGTEKTEPVAFKKVGGGWLIEMPLDGPRKKGGGPKRPAPPAPPASPAPPRE